MSERKPDKVNRNVIRFIAEQDGPVEQDLKRRLTELFEDHKTVSKAYLAVVDYGTPTTINVALCLRAFTSPDESLVQSISTVFASIFSPTGAPGYPIS